jgi:hypothetical protein
MPVCFQGTLQSDAIFARVWKASLGPNQESAVAILKRARSVDSSLSPGDEHLDGRDSHVL